MNQPKKNMAIIDQLRLELNAQIMKVDPSFYKLCKGINSKTNIPMVHITKRIVKRLEDDNFEKRFNF